MIAFRRIVPKPSVDDADNTGIGEIADQPSDALLELDDHFRDADIHQGVFGNGTLILNNRIGNREGEPEDDDVRKAFSFNTDTFPICTSS